MLNTISNTVTLTAIAGAIWVFMDPLQATAESHNAATIDEDQFYCMQQNIFFEARNQDLKGQEAVAWVTLNRVEARYFPDTICEVVWQNKAFSWTHDGKPDVPSNNVIEQRAWAQAAEVAEKVLDQWAAGMVDPTGGADHYHAEYVEPFWADATFTTGSIGSHIFYRLYW
jgi:spore germination cell wall hydrolase CwlJ-like protein